jgi:sensor histidine kinase YesM
MKKIGKKHILLFLAQVAVWAIILFALPLATLLGTQELGSMKTSLSVAWGLFFSPLTVYFANFYLLGPFLFFRRKYGIFVLCNLVMILLLNHRFFQLFLFRDRIPQASAMTTDMWIGFFSGFMMFLILNCVIAAIAISLRHFIRIRQIKQQLKEEKAKNTEAELAWLKNQINPHFLFNTLNNISSLTQINPDAAQDAIAQLSDLLRYAMYETNKKTVPIDGEVAFMRNYISLMELRCNEQTVVNTVWNVKTEGVKTEIAPLIFISLIENAFKHGVSSNRPSTIDIRLEQTETEAGEKEIIFSCDNTNYPKNDTDRSGSGIGVENTRRRLELMYHDKYEWEQTAEDNMYHVKIKLKI